MNNNQMVFLRLLTFEDHSIAKYDQQTQLKKFYSLLCDCATSDLAQVYVDAAFLRTFLEFLTEQHWLAKKKAIPGLVNFSEFISPFLQIEFAPRVYLHELLQRIHLLEIKSLVQKTLTIELATIAKIKLQTAAQQKTFASHVLALISELFEFENQLQLSKQKQDLPCGLSLYRTYDRLDEIFRLNYLADHGMKTDLTTTERLYEGAGVGVQSGYSTLLLALRYLQPQFGARIIDLGSGYGRLGLVIGLMRPDMYFKGYEYVQHRVDIANQTAQRLQLNTQVEFYCQDLAATDFKIPDAEIYYLYDPFSISTYKHVLNQLLAVSQRQKIVIVTKGNARSSLLALTQQHAWPAPLDFDNTNLSLFASN